MAKKEVSVRVGPGFLGMLTILFIGLKLTGYIAWSWWWVTSPMWLPFAVVIGGGMLVVAVAFLIWVLTEVAKELEKKLR